MLFLVATILLGSFVVVRLSYAAWSEPSVAPPGNNTNPPLDTSSTSQNKTGALTVGSTTNFTATGMYAPIYYDANNTSYYLEPSNTTTAAYLNGSVVVPQGSALRAGLNSNWVIGQITDNSIHIGSTHVANNFSFDSNSGSGLMYISSVGSVGINTANPQIQLQVGSNGGIYNDGSTEMFSKNLYYNNAWKYITNGFASGILTDSSGNIHIYTSPSGTAAATAALSEDMTILNSGDIGIGTSSPTTAGLVIASNVSGVALDVDNNRIANLANPVNAQDAATKSYVDAASSGGSDAANSMTANSGMYENKIIAMNPPAAYTEICFKNGATYYDIHAAGVATGGGNCSVGDTGYIIEDAVRSAAHFTTAKQVCTENNMRLPEPYEWQLACMNASTWGLSSMGTQWEWASNFTLPMYDGGYLGVGAAIFGSSGCTYANWDWLGFNSGNQYSYYYRCAR